MCMTYLDSMTKISHLALHQELSGNVSGRLHLSSLMPLSVQLHHPLPHSQHLT